MTSLFAQGADPDKCEDRRENDFYGTPWEATEALMLAEEPWLRHFNEVDEPACGDGAMAEVIRGHGKTVYASDLVYRGYGKGDSDFLRFDRSFRGGAMITNPPFNMAEDFIKHAHRLEYAYIAMILKANYWHAQTRIPLFREYKPVRIRPYGWRIDFTGGGSNHFDCIAVIWMPRTSKTTEYCDPMMRPKFLSQPSLF